MARRGGLWLLGLLMCGGLLPACTRSVPVVTGEADPMGQSPATAQDASPAQTGSPYHAQTLPGEGDLAITGQPRMPLMDIKPTPKAAVTSGPTEGTLAMLPRITSGQSAGSASSPSSYGEHAIQPTIDPTPAPESTTLPPVGPTMLKPTKTAVANLPPLAPSASRVVKQLPDRLPIKTTIQDKHQIATASKVPQPPVALVEATRCFLDNRPADALHYLNSYDKDNQELLLLLLPLAARLTEGKLQDSNGRDVAFYVEQLNSLLVNLRPRSELTIDKICFCRDIQGFGSYHALPENPTYHHGDRVDIYVEVRNFTSEKKLGAGGEAIYVTRLETSAEITMPDRRKVWPAGRDRFVFHRDGPDICRTLRHDYFDHCFFTLPADLPGGSYTLWIQMEDLPTKRVVRRSLDFIVGSDVRVPGQ